MSFVSLISRRIKSFVSVKPKVIQIRWFRKDDDDDGGIVDGGGAWAERERALEGVYIRKLVNLSYLDECQSLYIFIKQDYEHIQNLKKKLERKRQHEDYDDDDDDDDYEFEDDDDDEMK